MLTQTVDIDVVAEGRKLVKLGKILTGTSQPSEAIKEAGKQVAKIAKTLNELADIKDLVTE